MKSVLFSPASMELHLPLFIVLIRYLTLPERSVYFVNSYLFLSVERKVSIFIFFFNKISLNGIAFNVSIYFNNN